MQMESDIKLGQKFGKWKVYALKYYNPNCDEPYFLVRCDCGSIKARAQSQVLSGQSTSCGCDQSKLKRTRTTRKLKPARLVNPNQNNF